MKKFALLFALLLAVGVRADVETTAVPVTIGGGGGTFDGGTITTPILFPAGTVGAPSIAWAADADGTGTGLYRQAANSIGFAINGTEQLRLNSAGQLHAVTVRVANVLDWSTGIGTSADTQMTREAAAVLQMGADVNGAAIAQTLKAHDGITGTDIAGANMTVACGRGTGAGTACDSILQTGTPLATGTTAQTLVTRYQAEGGLRALTDATATTVITVTTGNDLSCGGQIFFTVEAADAANQQTTTGVVSFAAADNAAGDGGETCSSGLTGTNVSAATSGTLTVTTDATDGGTDVCNIRLTATGSLTETVGPRVRYSVVFNPTSSNCAFTPQ
jgi:hypothetical protein